MTKGTNSNNVNSANLILAALGTAILAPIDFESYSESQPISIARYQNLEVDYWEGNFAAKDNHDMSKFSDIKSFSEKIVTSTRDIDPEIQKLINDRFWDLI
ncbi:hypothetical protein [Ekhidna sp.]|uniref:hypothetical protein n=1 Tax=Ekhidna sp. TaxID=2608089 RepID=UPI003CCB7F9D